MTDFTDKPDANERSADKPKPPAIVPLSPRRRIMYLLAVPTGAAFIFLLLVWKFPDLNVWNIPEGPLFASCFAVTFVGMGAIFLCWRCPVCGSYLGRDAHPPMCAKCGVYFED
jgi:hypothetical protein